MSFRLELHGRRILVAGSARASRFVVADAEAQGARVTTMPAEELIGLLESAAVVGGTGGTDGTGGIGGIVNRPELVIWVEGTADARERLASAARLRRIPFADADPAPSTPDGHVTLVGGGPGLADLITVAGRRALAQADVVLHDRLGPRDDLHLLAPAAELVDVGKTPGHHAVPQHEIERMLVEKAQAGMRVVRLKGGDPFVFGRGGEEVLACRRAGIPVDIVPGVTSAIAVPAEAGIPVTHREVSRAFTVISGHVPLSEGELAHAVGLGGTLVVLMGVATLPHLTAGLRRHGMRADMPVAVLERGFTDDRRSTVTTLSGALEAVTVAGVRSPAVIVIGEVVNATRDADLVLAGAGLAGAGLHEAGTA